jgi:hypothetical protein
MPNFDFSKLEVPPDCAERMKVDEFGYLLVWSVGGVDYPPRQIGYRDWVLWQALDDIEKILTCRDAQIGWWNEMKKQPTTELMQNCSRQINLWWELERIIK